MENLKNRARKTGKRYGMVCLMSECVHYGVVVHFIFVLPRFLQSCYTDHLARVSEGNLLAR